MLEHEHFILNCNVKKCLTNTKEANKWMKSLISSIDMEIFMGPYSKYSTMEGNEGMTSVAIITTSHLACHFFESEDGNHKLSLDVYSCKPFDVRDVLTAIDEFEPYNVDYVYFERNEKIKNKEGILNRFLKKIKKFI